MNEQPPELTVNRDFVQAFVEAPSPCFAMGLVDIGDHRTGFLALKPDCVIPSDVMARGFSFGHGLLGTSDYTICQFAFHFYGFATYQALVNPANAIVRETLRQMVKQNDYFFFAISSDQSATAFRSELGSQNLSGLPSNMPVIEAATTTDRQYEQGLAAFTRNPEPSAAIVEWVCRDDLGYLDPNANPLVMNASG